MKTYPYGSVRFAVGLLIIIGVAGSADQTPLTLSLVPWALLGLLLASWGLSRMENHAGLKHRLRQLRARIPRTHRQRHQRIYLRAARR